MARILTRWEIIPRRPDSLADETVNGEPVCNANFLLTIYREFYENRAAARKIARKNAAKSVSCKTIPYKMKQGINSRRTGNLSSRAGNLQRLAGPPCAGAVEQPQRRLLGVSGLAIEDFKLKASTNAQLTSQPKPSLMALQKMPIGQLWGGGRLVDLLKSSLSRLWMA